MADQVVIQIDKVNQKVREEERTSKKSGQNYTIHEYDCNGYISGNYAEHFVVQTLSGKICALIEQGNYQTPAEVDVFQGRTSYKIATPRDAQYQPPAQNPMQAPHQNAPAQVSQQIKQPTSYTFQDLKDLLLECWEWAQINGSEAENPDEINQKIAATLFIGATNQRVKVDSSDPLPLENNNPMDLRSVLNKAGLTVRIDEAGVGDKILASWYKQCGGVESQFIVRANKELTEAGI